MSPAEVPEEAAVLEAAVPAAEAVPVSKQTAGLCLLMLSEVPGHRQKMEHGSLPTLPAIRTPTHGQP